MHGFVACAQASFLAVCDYRWPLKVRHQMIWQDNEHAGVYDTIRITQDRFSEFFQNFEKLGVDAKVKFPNKRKVRIRSLFSFWIPPARIACVHKPSGELNCVANTLRKSGT